MSKRKPRKPRKPTPTSTPLPATDPASAEYQARIARALAAQDKRTEEWIEAHANVAREDWLDIAWMRMPDEDKIKMAGFRNPEAIPREAWPDIIDGLKQRWRNQINASQDGVGMGDEPQ